MARYDLTVARWREARALELAVEGWSWEQIAAELGYAGRSGAWKAVHRVLARNAGAAGERYRHLLLLELEAEQQSLWPAAVGGVVGSAERVLRVMDRRQRLVGIGLQALAPRRPRTVGRRPKSVDGVHPVGLGAFTDFVVR